MTHVSGYVIRRTDQGGGYLSRDPGRTGQTWVRAIEKARIFPDCESAEAECCPDNEVPMPLASVLS